MDGTARRFIVFYFPDGVPGASSNGEPSAWHATGSEFGFSLPEVLDPLTPWHDHCVFLNGLSMGGTDAGSHPGGAKKLLTAVDGGMGTSVDQVLASTVGASMPHRHVYLGVQANANGASGDKHVSYVAPGTSTPPEDNPRRAFERLFTGATGSTGGGGPDPRLTRRASILDDALAELGELRGMLDASQQTRLDLHLDAVREVERRVETSIDAPPPEASCAEPGHDVSIGDAGDRLYEPERFPTTLRAQIDNLVTAMACDLTRVGVIQNSVHTSELIMSRFAGSEMHDPGFDMRSHQASHYGPAHDEGRREFRDFVLQRRWFVQQFAYLLEQLAARPEGEGTMLDHSVVLLCTEVSDGNTHLHDNMPFVVAGGAGGAWSTGRLIDRGYRRHGNLFVSICRAMGHSIDRFGDASSGPLDGLG